MGFLYRFLNEKGEIIYIGKTLSKNLLTRMNGHNHLPPEAYMEKSKVECVEIESKGDLAIYEMVYINKYKPKYNKANKYDDEMQISIPELQWIISNDKNNERTKKTRERRMNNSINMLINQIEKYDSCELIVQDMMRYFEVKQRLISDDNIKSLNFESENEESEGFDFVGSKNEYDIIMENMYIPVHEYAKIEVCCCCYGMLSRAYPVVEDEGVIKISIRKHLLPYLYCIKDNLARECNKTKNKLEKMKIELHSLLKT